VQAQKAEDADVAVVKDNRMSTRTDIPRDKLEE